MSGSLALMSDAGHMFTDSLALLLSLMAVRIALRPASAENTYGYMRTEILAALANGTTLIVLCFVILYEAIQRIMDPAPIEGPLMLVVAIAGFGANAAGIYLLHDRSADSLNVRGAFLHMMGDLLSSAAVIVGALLIMFFDFRIADPILSILIAAIIAYGAWKLMRQSVSILLESTPAHLELEDVRKGLLGVESVKEVHDLHIWTLTSGMYALSAHVVVEDVLVSECAKITEQCEQILKERFSITHTTIQIECETCTEEACIYTAGTDHRVGTKKDS